MKQNKILKVFLLVLIVLSAFTLSACNKTPSGDSSQGNLTPTVEGSDGIVYSLSDDGLTAEVIGCDNRVENVVISDVYEGVPVTKISMFAFESCYKIKSVTIPDSVISIEDHAFSACENLTEITVGKGLKKLGFAFSTIAISKVNYNGDVAGFCGIEGAFTFYANGYDLYIGGKLVTEVEVPSSVKVIAKSAFSGCKSITKLKVCSGVQMISANAFQNCENLAEIEISDDVFLVDTDFAKTAYYKNIENWETRLIAGNNAVPEFLYIGKHLVASNSPKRSITVKDGTVSVSGMAFQVNPISSLESIVFPSSVKAIGADGFVNYIKLSNVEIPESVVYIGERTFSKTPFYNNKTNWEDGLLYINDVLIGVDEQLENVTVREGTSVITARLLINSSLKTVDIPKSVLYIYKEFLTECINLENITVDKQNPVYKSVNGDLYTKDGSVLITRVSEITYINNPEYKIIDGNAYSKNGKVLVKWLQSGNKAVIPDAVEKIGTDAFRDNANLTAVEFGSNLKTVGENAFANCVALEEVILPDSLTGVRNFAFSGCTALKTVDLGKNTTVFAFRAFDECKNIEKITVHKGNAFFSGMAFSVSGGTEKERDVYFDGTLEEWQDITFADQSATPLFSNGNLYIQGELLTEFIVPDGQTEIGRFAFSFCSSLKKVVLGKDIKKVGVYAFYSCLNITEFTFNLAIEEFGYGAIGRCPIENLIIPQIKCKIEIMFPPHGPNVNKYLIEGDKTYYPLIINPAFGKDYEILMSIIYYYSETEPSLNEEGTDYDGKYWRYGENGEIIIWEFNAE